MPKNEILSIEQIRMNSLEIAKLTYKEHKNVLADIRNMLKALNIKDAEFLAPYKMPSGQKIHIYNLPKRETYILITGYSIELRALIIDRWQYLEEQFKINQQKSEIRKVIKQDFKLMNDALKEKRALQGKETKGYHYSTETDMLYLIVLGKRKRDLEIEGDIRDTLNLEQTKALEHLQRLNASMLDLGLEYDERKERLTKLFKTKYKTKPLLH